MSEEKMFGALISAITTSIGIGMLVYVPTGNEHLATATAVVLFAPLSWLSYFLVKKL